MCLALPGRVVELHGDDTLALGTVDFDGTRREVCFAAVPDVAVGDYVVVHVGFALAKVDEASARETLAMFRDLGVLEDELGADPAGGDGGPGAVGPSSTALP